MSGQLLDAAGMAQELQVTAETVRDLARKGEIPFHKVGRVYRFDRDEVLNSTRSDWSRFQQSARSRGRRRAA